MKLLNYILLVACSIMILSSCSSVGGKMNPASKSESTVERSPLADTTKLKSDLNDLVNSITSGKPDTNKLKAAASDILSGDANILSDSGIGKLAGKDPSAKEAGDMLEKLRNTTGITPSALDSLKKTISTLDQ